MNRFLVLILCMLAAAANAEDFPAATWRDQLNPLASPDAYPGGEISIFLGQYPKSLNYYLDPSTQSAQIFGSLFETLLSMNPVTLEYEPGLADRWSISADKKEFTFFIDRQAQWSDGRPVTAQDVKWTYDVIMDPKNLTGSHKIDMERFYPPEVIDSHTIRFRTKNVHWRNLGAAGGFYILPKHALAGLNFNKVNFEFPVVSGLYRIGTIKEGIFLELIRRDNWWQRKFLRNQGTGNFQTLKFRFYAERENAFEAFKKGMIDLYPVYTARLWVNETRGERFDKNWIIKQKVHNHNPVGFQGFAMNMRKPPFNDVKVRQAMAYLLDRRKMNRTLMYNQYFQHRAYYEGLYSKEVPCPNPLIEFDPGKARALLKEAGWQVNSGTGNLEKNGQPFTFKFLTRSASSEKFLAIYAEDLKDVGIQLVIDKKDWAAWARDMDEFNYQMTWAAWGPSIFIDPEGMWSSSEADRKGGNNITGFKSQIVDQLIEKQKHIFEIQKRNVINRRIDHIIAKTFPYVLLWNINYTRLLYWNKFGTPDSVLSKYGSESSAYAYWWFDEDSAAELSEAREAKLVLPPKPAVVYFDDVFQSQPMQ